MLLRVANHRVVLFDFAVATPTFAPVERFVWAFPRAKWSSLRVALASTDWAPIIDGPSVDSAVASFTDHLFHIAQAHIPYRKCSMRKSTHPWLNDRCAAAVARKCATAGTPDFGAAQKECNAILSEEYRSHVNRLRHKLSTLPRGSKRWWKLNRELLNKKAAMSSIPSLKTADGSYVFDSEATANLLGTVSQRSVLMRQKFTYQISL